MKPEEPETAILARNHKTMKSNSIPANSGQLILLGEQMQAGVTALGTQIPITLVTATQVGSDTGAFSTADAAFNAGRSAQQTASDAYQATTGPLYDWLLSVSNMLASRASATARGC